MNTILMYTENTAFMFRSLTLIDCMCCPKIKLHFMKIHFMYTNGYKISHTGNMCYKINSYWHHFHVALIQY